MPLRVVTPPTAALVTLAEARSQVRIDFEDDDADLTRFIAAATSWLDGPTGVLGRALAEQELELVLDGFGDSRHAGERRKIELPLPPLLAVTSVEYLDPTGAPVVLDPALYRRLSAAVVPAFGGGWPATAPGPETVTIRYTAGYPAGENEAAAIPVPLKQAVLLVVGDLYANRESQQVDQSRGTAVENPTLEALIAPHRVIGF